MVRVPLPRARGLYDVDAAKRRSGWQVFGYNLGGGKRFKFFYYVEFMGSNRTETFTSRDKTKYLL